MQTPPHQQRPAGHPFRILIPPYLGLLFSLFIGWDRRNMLALLCILASLSWSLIASSHYWAPRTSLARWMGRASLLIAAIAIFGFVVFIFR